ncbi:hypothetical protein B9479_004539 [Cryptococcus floricola]|uniref:Zn(2)-C6 fungal-type domain-containing protein n=1 Tax=Cryptococcus floricola TaxID=2591691 RepID=A0A5D3AX09_9TREE|nr:hypothetical protein B9479_004539 [Cryptococcus floricola]
MPAAERRPKENRKDAPRFRQKIACVPCRKSRRQKCGAHVFSQTPCASCKHTGTPCTWCPTGNDGWIKTGVLPYLQRQVLRGALKELVLHMRFHMDEAGEKMVYDHPATYEEMRIPGGPELERFEEFMSSTAAKKVKGTRQARSSAMGALEALGNHGPPSLGGRPNPVHPYNQPRQPQQPPAGPSSHHGTSLLYPYPSTSVHPHTIPAMPAQPPVYGYHRPVPTQARQQLPPSMAGGHTVQRAQSHAQLDANLVPFVSTLEEGFRVPRARRLSHQEARETNRRFSEKDLQMPQVQQLYPGFTSGQPTYSGLPNYIQPGFGSRLVARQDLYGTAQAGNIHGPSDGNQHIYGGRSTQINTAYDHQTLYGGSSVHAGTTVDAGLDQYLGSSFPQVNPNLHVPFNSQSLYHTGNDNTTSFTLSGMYHPAPGTEYQDISPITNLTSSVDSIPSPPPLIPSSSFSGSSRDNIPQQHRNLTPEEMSDLLRCIDMSTGATAEQEMFQTIDSPETCMSPRAGHFKIHHPPAGCMDPRDMHLSYADGVHGAPGFGPPPFDLESLVVPHDDGCLKGDEEKSCSVAADPDAGLALWQ